MKKGINVRVKGNLRIEQIVVRCLRVLSIVLLVLSVVLELVPFSEKCIECYHIDFIISVLLGISASSFISFVVVAIPYNNNKNAQINSITDKLKNIYYSYIKIYYYVYRVSNGEVHSEDHLTDISIYNIAKRLETEISEVSCSFEKTEVISDEIMDIINVLETDVLIVIAIIKQFYFLIVPPGLLDAEIDSIEKLKKQDHYKSAEQECYTALLNSINSVIELETLKTVFSPLVPGLDEITNMVIGELNNLLDRTKKSANSQRELHHTTKIIIEIQNITNKHFDEYVKKTFSGTQEENNNQEEKPENT